MAFNATFVAADAYAVTPSDTAGNPGVALYVGGTGTVTLVTAKGHAVEFQAVPAGFIIPLAFTSVKATGTSATLLVAFGP